MSNIPMLFSPEAASVWMRLSRAKTIAARVKALASFRPRHFKPQLGIELGLTDPVSGLNMGQTAEVLAKEFGISRAEQDQFAMVSHHKAEAAQKRCFLSGEIAKVQLDDATELDKDNGPRYGQSMDQLSRLRPLFDRAGPVTAGNSCPVTAGNSCPVTAGNSCSVTAGNSCPLTDGAAALVVTSDQHAKQLGAQPLGYVTASAIAGCDPRRMGLGPVYAIAKLLNQTGLRLDDFDLIELNEAFAAQVIACIQALGSKSFAQNQLGRSSAVGELREERLNVHGGAIALGHPVGTTGTRIVLTLLRSLRERGLHRGLATLCVGGGQGVALVVQTTQ